MLPSTNAKKLDLSDVRFLRQDRLHASTRRARIGSVRNRRPRTRRKASVQMRSCKQSSRAGFLQQEEIQLDDVISQESTDLTATCNAIRRSTARGALLYGKRPTTLNGETSEISTLYHYHRWSGGALALLASLVCRAS